MEYTVKKLANLAGMSVRTLHYYDEIGLLTPSRLSGSGYRVYGEKELARLQHILFFRELEFPLDEIKTMMNASSFDSSKALQDHRELLRRKKARLEKLISSVDKALEETKGAHMSSHTDYSAFSNESVEQYKDEVRERWGNTQAYKQSQERTSKWKKEDWARISQEADRVLKNVVEHMSQGPESATVQHDMLEYHRYIENFYDCTPGFMANLGQMYVADERFGAYFAKYHPDLAIFMRDALALYAKQNG